MPAGLGGGGGEEDGDAPGDVADTRVARPREEGARPVGWRREVVVAARSALAARRAGM